MGDKVQIKGWRTRREQERELLRRRVWDESIDVELLEEGERRTYESMNFSQTLCFDGRRKNVRRNVDLSAREALREMRKRDHAEYTLSVYRSLTPEQKRARSLAGRTEEEHRAVQRLWYEKNKELVNARRRERRKAFCVEKQVLTVDQVKERKKAYARRTIEKRNARNRINYSQMNEEQKAFRYLVRMIYEQFLQLSKEE